MAESVIKIVNLVNQGLCFAEQDCRAELKRLVGPLQFSSGSTLSTSLLVDA